MKKLFALLALLMILPCAAIAGGEEGINEAPERIYFATIAPDAQATPIPALALETVPPERTVYPCTAVAAAPYGDTAPLFEKPDDRSRVIMNYYRGARVTVLRETMPGYVLVQVGGQQASVMGHMRRSDLAFGSAALREIVPEFVKIEMNREAVIRRYCDARAEEIGVCTSEGTYYTIGKNDDKGVQLYAPAGMTIESQDAPLLYHTIREGEAEPFGFVQLETGMARGYDASAIRWETEPVPGEITRMQAIELAIWWMKNAEGGIPPELRDEEALRLLPYEVKWECSPPGMGYVELSILVSYECDEYSITVGLYPDGEIRYGRYEEAAEGS